MAGTSFASSRHVLRRVFPAVAVIASLLWGPVSLAHDQHGVCARRHHACAAVLVIARCCCGPHGVQSDATAAPMARVSDSNAAWAPALLAVAPVLANVVEFVRTAPSRTVDPPGSESDRSLLFGVLRL